MRFLFGFICVLALGILGCSEMAGTGGTGGTGDDGGSGGDGGNGGVGGGVACVRNEFECTSAQIDPIEEMCETIVPDQPSACSGTESTDNPASCTASANPVTHRLSRMQVAGDCNVGFNLDGCDGETCRTPIAGPGIDGVNGVDNALVFWDDTCLDKGCDPRDLSPIDQAFHDAICAGTLEIAFEVSVNTDEDCALVRVLDDGEPVATDPIPMNLSGDGCLSGAVGTVPIRLGGVDGAIENALMRMTVSSAGFSDGILGGTVRGATAGAVSDAIVEGLSQVVHQSFDINADLSGNSAIDCDSLSMTLEIGGSVEMEMLP